MISSFAEESIQTAGLELRRMTFYEKEIERIRNMCYSNQRQIDAVIGTRKYIDSHFENGLTLDLLSHIQLTSKYHLLRLFKRYYGLTPKQYLIERRIEKSKECLKNGMTATEACFEIGFESLGSFSTLFKNKVGLTPAEFRKRATFKKRTEL